MKKYLQRLINVELTANQFVILLSSYLVFVFNLPFLSRTFDSALSLSDYSIPFLISVPLLLLLLTILVVSLFSWRYLLKPIATFLVIAGALIFFSIVTYGVTFDYGMVQNVFETDSAEAFSYLNLYATVFFILLGLLPALWLLKVKVHFNGFFGEFLQRTKLLTICVLSIAAILYFFYSSYAATLRNNRSLATYIVPFAFIDATVKYVHRNYFVTPLEFKTLDDKAKLLPNRNDKQVMVMIVGETARASSFSSNGYNKPTNQYTEQHSTLSFTDVVSCGTATAVSVPCMFAIFDKDNFDKRQAAHQQNVLDLAALAGVDVLWIDNNSGCKDVCNRVEHIMLEKKAEDPLCDGKYCFDEILVRELKSKLADITQPKTLIVLHMIGSHGPTYYQRYPETFKQFTPDCARSDIQNCSSEELRNTYDNSILYTDFVVAEVIETLAKLSEEQPEIATSMLYMSDHGESLGENGVYLHGLPYAFAPDEQTHIPLLYWQSQQTTVIDRTCLDGKRAEKLSHANLFHSLLGALGVETSTYDYQQDMFASCY